MILHHCGIWFQAVHTVMVAAIAGFVNVVSMLCCDFKMNLKLEQLSSFVLELGKSATETLKTFWQVCNSDTVS